MPTRLTSLALLLLPAACAANAPPPRDEPVAGEETAGPSPERSPDERPEARFRFVYRAAVRDLPAGAELVRLWVPVPVDTPEQEVSRVRAHLVTRADGEPRLETTLEVEALGDETSTLGDERVRLARRAIRNGLGRSLYVETPGQEIELELSFDVRRWEASAGGDATHEELRAALAADRYVPIDGKAARTATMLPGSSDPTETASVLYAHTLDHMTYAKPAGGGWGRGDAEWACDSRHGNCTDFHSYFMALARSKGIPARFEMGFPVPGGDERVAEVPGYHCWAWFHDPDRGWVPVDISEADKDPSRAEYYFGTLDPWRVAMTGGRDLELDPPPDHGPLNFFVYPHVEVDGETWEGVETSFRRVRIR